MESPEELLQENVGFECVENLQCYCEDKEEPDTGKEHGRGSSLPKCTKGLHSVLQKPYSREMDTLCLKCRCNGNISEMVMPCVQSNPTELCQASPKLLRPACLMWLDRMGEDTLPNPELSQNPVSKPESLESCKVSITPRRLSSDLISVGCPIVYFHSYNPTWETAGYVTCKLEYPV
ncbi:hypothetical protein M9H77_09130 [Catharanthus roseus]|uniref:Uncharacterized protein n=1 Tax=Catharanthus roseus TaxID=4058 RepID=A0ACC0BZW1_CATRO|nr:hypothetical protein M9H77_09130 [Catharanthus roseus]